MFYLCFSNFKSCLKNWLDDVRRHFVFRNLSFNFEPLALDVEACRALVGANSIGIYGLVSRKKYYINTSNMTNVEHPF
jgi:hypothetical protein